MKLRVTSYELRVTIAILILSFILSGCVVRTYSVTKERQDQDLTVGNLGYIEGQVPEGKIIERKPTRTTKVVEIELYSPVKFEKPKEKLVEETAVEKTEEKIVEGNRGYITKSEAAEIIKPVTLEKYTVQKDDTLQKISQRFYGTAKKWTKIYEANKDILKASDKIYPGQVIDIPVESLKETKEILK